MYGLKIKVIYSRMSETKRGEEEASQKYVASYQNTNSWTPDMAKQRTQVLLIMSHDS